MRAFVALVLILAAALATPVRADEPYPSKPIHLVVPFAPGGSTDALARILAEEMRGQLGQVVIVDNRPGANGNLGGDLVAKAPADGYTVLMAAAGPILINKSLYSHMPYDPVKDLRAVTQLIVEPNMMVIGPKIPAKNMAEFIAYAKAHPNDMTFGSPGNGSPAQLAGEWFNQLTGTTMTHVPYKGTGPALNDLLGGQISMMIDNMSAVLPQVRAGKLTALAVSTPKRAVGAPDVPTFAEAGVKGLQFNAWKGLMVPAATPVAIVDRLYQACVKILAKPDVRKRLLEIGAEPIGSTPAQFEATIHEEAVTWAALVKSTNTRID